jgi:hypothetical protein
MPGIAEIVGGVVAAIALAGLARNIWRRTLGRRRDRYNCLARLGTGAQFSFFTSVIGEPPAIKRKVTADAAIYAEDGGDFHLVKAPREYWEAFFIDRDFYLQTISDVEEETVLSFSITTRTRRFRPVFYGHRRPGLNDRIRWRLRFRERYTPLFRVELGVTRFSELRPWGLPKIRSWLGARASQYSEELYFGNPGYYQTFVFSTTSAGHIGACGDLVTIGETNDAIGGNFTWPKNDENALLATATADMTAGSELPDMNEADLGGSDLDDEVVTDMEQDYEEEDSREAQRRAVEELDARLAEVSGLVQFRRATAINTYTVIGPSLNANDYPSTYGPHGDEVRQIE